MCLEGWFYGNNTNVTLNVIKFIVKGANIMAVVYKFEDYNLTIFEDKRKYVKAKNKSYSKPEKKIRIQLDAMLKRLFTLENKIPIIDFLNAAYGDSISYEAKITYGDKEIINSSKGGNKFTKYFSDIYINVEDGKRSYEYEIEFQTKYEKGLVIRMFRYGFEGAVKSLNYKEIQDGFIEINFPEPYIIVVEQKGEVPEELKIRINIPKQGAFTYKCNVLRYYEKNIQDLINSNMYILLPISIITLRRQMERLNKRNNLKEEDKEKVILELKDMTENILKNLDILYNKNKINLENYDVMVTIMENITSYLENNYWKFYGIEEDVSIMVKSFYDKKVEEKGIEKGIEKGEKKSNELLIRQIVKRFGDISDDIKNKIMKLPIDKVNEIGEGIFDFESLEDIVKLL